MSHFQRSFQSRLQIDLICIYSFLTETLLKVDIKLNLFLIFGMFLLSIYQILQVIEVTVRYIRFSGKHRAQRIEFFIFVDKEDSQAIPRGVNSRALCEVDDLTLGERIRTDSFIKIEVLLNKG